MTRDRVVDAAVVVADRAGLAGVSMRTVGKEVGVQAMSLYHHVASKDALLDALADWVFSQVPPPAIGAPWRAALAAKATATRRVLSAHPWGLGLVESRRQPGPALLTHHDAVLGCLRAAGFPVELATHAFSAVDAYTYGFVLTEVHLPFAPGEDLASFARELRSAFGPYPHLQEMVRVQVFGGSFRFEDEFDYGLQLILDGLEARLSAG